MIFLTANQENARRDLAGLIYKGNLLDRATPVRNMIGALALAKQLDYRQTYDAYEKLNDEARSKFSLDNFLKVKQKEREIIAQGQQRVPILMTALFDLDKAININTQAQSRNRVIGLISSFAGGFLLLVANLIASVEKE